MRSRERTKADAARGGPRDKDRRAQSRSSGGNAATSIVQLLIQHPGQVANVLERDLAAGADADELSGLLDA